MLRIGRLFIGIRLRCDYGFKWFYRPLLKSTEEEEHFRMWWIGWHLFIAYRWKEANHE